MKLYRIAMPIGATNPDTDSIIISFDTSVDKREIVDANGNSVTIMKAYFDENHKLHMESDFSVSQQNAFYAWEDDFEDGHNEFDGTYEISRGVGYSIRRTARIVDTSSLENGIREFVAAHNDLFTDDAKINDRAYLYYDGNSDKVCMNVEDEKHFYRFCEDENGGVQLIEKFEKRD